MRDAVAALVSAVDGAVGSGLAVVVATDVDEARSRQHVPGVVTAARRGRRGPGRGLYCANGSVEVVQFVQFAAS